MRKKNLKSAISAFFGALLVVALTGCAAGPDAMTRNLRQVTDGVEGVSGSIKALNVLLVAQEDGSAVLVGTFVNTSETNDEITSITANGIVGEISVSPLETGSPAAFTPGLCLSVTFIVPVPAAAAAVQLDVMPNGKPFLSKL